MKFFLIIFFLFHTTLLYSDDTIDEIIVTDTIPLQETTKKIKKIRQISVSEMLAETIRRIHQKESVSSLFME